MNVGSTPGVRQRPDGAEAISAASVRNRAAESLEIRVHRQIRIVVGMVIPAMPVDLPDFQPHPVDGLSGGIHDVSGNIQNGSVCDTRAPCHGHEIIVAVQRQGRRVEGAAHLRGSKGERRQSRRASQDGCDAAARSHPSPPLRVPNARALVHPVDCFHAAPDLPPLEFIPGGGREPRIGGQDPCRPAPPTIQRCLAWSRAPCAGLRLSEIKSATDLRTIPLMTRE